VIATGGIVLASSLLHWTSPDPQRFLIYFGLALLASLLKIRLPGITGTYSLSFLFILIGIVYFTLPETLVTGCAGALVQTALNTKKRPTPIQVLFNMANFTLSIGLCFLVAHGPLAAGLASYRPALLALVACLYFATNTILVSGVLSLLEGKPLGEVCQQWYLWSFPYYLVGAAVVGLLPLSAQSTAPESWLILIPPLYLVHFYYGLSVELRPRTGDAGSKVHALSLPIQAKLYLGVVIAAGLMLLSWGALHWEPQAIGRFGGYLLMAVLASMCKVRLPRMTGTISVNFVVLLAAIAELGFFEVMVLGGVAAVVQSVWRPKQRPMPVQIFFNLSTMVLSTALAFAVCRVALAPVVAGSLSPLLVVATAILYGSNTIMLSAALCLVEGRPLGDIWARCCFWSFPYYMMGAALAGLMIITSRAVGWQPAFLVLPLMGLVYVSYRLHIRAAQLPAG
jgi:hypothetical protein